MKHLIYFLLFSSVVFSQNYQYAIEEAKTNNLSAPTGLIASQITENSAVLTWSAPTNNNLIVEYGIYSKNVLLGKSDGTNLSFRLTDLIPETSYTLSVRAIDNKGQMSIDSEFQTFVTKSVVSQPTLGPPSDLIASQITDNSVVLNWTAPAVNTSITDYGIYSKNVLLFKSVGNGTTYKVTGLSPETIYSLTVRSLDQSGNISNGSNVLNFTTSKLSAPIDLIASQITDNSVVLSWTAPTVKSSITDYGIYNKNVLLFKSVGTSTTYKVTGLIPETAYSLTVRSLDKALNWSLDSNVQTITTSKLSAPTALIASQITENSVVLNWTAPESNSSITDYGIYNKSVLLIKSVGISATYNVTGLTPETAYSLTVRSLDKTGNMSLDSNVQTFTTSKLSAPTALIASQIAENSVVLNWAAPAINSSITDYGIYSKNVLLVKSVGTSTTYKVTGLTPETAYSLTVRSLDKAGNMSLDSNVQAITTSKAVVAAGVNNQLEEIEYFKAYLLPIAQKATLQQALDKYGSVRLEKGDYSGVKLVLKSNQRLYGHPTLSQVSSITIASGSSNVFLIDLFMADAPIVLQSGGIISNCTFKSIKWTTLQGTNVMFENNSLINFGGLIRLDCSQSGYIRNNKLIRYGGGTYSDLFVMKGNNTTPSYGNVNLWSNFLTPHGNTTNLDNLSSATFVGIDSEAWNLTNDSEGWNLPGGGTRAMFYAKNMGNIKIADLNGGNGGTPVQNRTPVFNIDALNLSVLGRGVNDPTDILSVRTNSYFVNGLGTYTREAGAVTGFSFNANLAGKDIKYNDVAQTSIINNPADVTKISNIILDKQYTPWARPTWETLPDPLGPNWQKQRVGKPDSTTYIQNLINTNAIAELPEGVYYISSTLKIPADRKHGIIGKGTGKTVICAMTDDFPILSIGGGGVVDGNIALAYLTLQGGKTGFYASKEYGDLNIAYQLMKFVVFRNQVNGIHLNRTGGFDNNFLENIAFVNCNKGFYQEPSPGDSGEINSAYVDKTMFYQSQFINCNTAFSMLATRADNLNAWVNCKFYGGNTALDLASNNFPIIANSEISNFVGTNVIRSNAISMYNTNVHGNSISSATLKVNGANIEGCNFLDNSPLFDKVLYNSVEHYVLNSTITGDALVTIPANQGYYPQSAVFSNSTLLANPTLSKLLVHIKAGVPKVIIDTSPKPYPQLLVTQ